MQNRIAVLSTGGLSLAAVAAIAMFATRQPISVRAVDPPDVVYLLGTVHDFTSTHSDFGITDPTVMGHTAWSVGHALPTGGRPSYGGGGQKVAAQWYDKDGNPIKPYATDAGLPGGHFDVDVFNELTTKQEYHQHQFDDKYNVTYIDLVNDPNLLWDEIVGSSYPNDLRVEFLNPHNASGQFLFQAAGAPIAVSAQQPFTTTFNPSRLRQFRVNFVSLFDMRKTSPGDVQGDIHDRDDAFSIRVYDTTTNVLIYELATYFHYKDGADVSGPDDGTDACGVPLGDAVGAYNGAGTGGVANPGSFDQWFRSELGVNQSTHHQIGLTRDSDGIYEFSTHQFYPIDDRLFGNEGKSHNSLFTYTINATFTYHACTGQFFQFEGNDDCWVYINNDLVLDIGGVGTSDRQFVALDRLGLTDGEEYPLDFFFAQRRTAFESDFHVRTNVLLETSLTLPINAAYD